MQLLLGGVGAHGGGIGGGMTVHMKGPWRGRAHPGLLGYAFWDAGWILDLVCDPNAVQVWVSAELDASGRVQFSGTSDSDLSKGLCAVLVAALSGLTPEEVLQVWSGGEKQLGS